MSSIESEFFKELREWSSRKLNIIQKYLDGFSRILGTSSQTMYYVDGFAGKGIYGNGKEGSPVRAAKLAISSYPQKLFCINVEQDPDNFADLTEQTQAFCHVVKNYPGTFSSNVNKILNDISCFPSLFFLDDFGVQGSDWLTVEKLLRRPYITDVWIRFDHKTVRRLDGFFNSGGKGATQKTVLLGEYFGIQDPVKLHQLLDGPTPEIRIQNAVRTYAQQLKVVLGQNGFVGYYPIRAIDGQSKYHLLFACRNSTAANLANDVVNNVEERFELEQLDYKEQQRLEKTGQQYLFSVDPTREEIHQSKVNWLKSQIPELVSKKGVLKVRELRYAIIQEHEDKFGKFRQKHLTDALTQLKRMQTISLTGAPSCDDTFVSLVVK